MSSMELHRQGSGQRLPVREQKQHNNAVARVVADTKLTAVKVDAEAALTGRMMERAVDIDDYRHALVGGDETKNAILTRLEMTFIGKVERIQRNFGSEFGL
ncbi:hypothetical protein [Flexivirga oryzae]|uniref:Uncharacterized protein n=1 Tax=Flexivirga oryzae TaxID=1794944 RepID=A0A839N7C0_9MICO|nr:hypothetical protein [Flexivirga oryzae]MBB2893167.1 hypothetical protein [Flexivirga oryzae]